ncbi:MAG TPA: NADH-quinone oxidoreductase subunit L [Ktedonobacterales bacterium]|jgi:NADH-quinone oxidoreductase subunit L|nr:NADH-quinone oxidoreductase subunit L [Ktedonobacterales bacterium]
MVNLTPWILAAPLVGFLALGLFGRFLPRVVVSVIGCGVVAVAFLLAVWQFISMLGVAPEQRVSVVTLWTWLTSGRLDISFSLLLDPLSAIMLLIVTGVGFLIHVYSIGYMADDPSYWRFFSYLNFFILAMALLVTADNFLFLLVGWAGVGLASFLLIGFWYTRSSAVAAARKAFVVNVIGDFGLMIAIFLVFGAFGTLSYCGVLNVCQTQGVARPAPSTGIALTSIDPNILLAIAIFLIIAAIAKSAQLPLHVWLPDAMEGPTPVSALIHAATMVTAGVYLVARASAIFTASPTAQIVIAVIAGASALYAAIVACAQTDIKRVLAYSTMSQLAYMFMGEAVEGYSNGIFHLTTHAYFKALLFMCAGAVIHALGGEQDMRKMGGLFGRLPRTFWMFLVGALSLAAIFPFSGFWSKDAILGDVLQKAINTGSLSWYALYGAGLLTAALTGFYIFRLLWLVFGGTYRGGAISVHGAGEAASDAHSATGDPLAQVDEPGPSMFIPMVILAVLSLLGGFYGTPWNDWIGEFLSPTVHSVPGLPTSDPRFWIADAVGLGVAILGIGFAWLRYGRGQIGVSEKEAPVVAFVGSGLGIDALYSAVIVRPLLALGRGLRVVVEDRALDGGTRGVGGLFAAGSRGVRTLQTGYARNYAVWIFLGAALIVLYFMVFPQLR